MNPFADPPDATAPDAGALLLGALAWLCADDVRAGRLLAVTGLDAPGLRARAGDPVLLAALGRFLADHEPDLVACADALGCAPGDIVAASTRVLEE